MLIDNLEEAVIGNRLLGNQPSEINALRSLHLSPPQNASPAWPGGQGHAAMIDPPLDQQQGKRQRRQPRPDFELPGLVARRGSHVASSNANDLRRADVRLGGGEEGDGKRAGGGVV